MVEQPPTVPLPDSTPPKVVSFSGYPSNGNKILPGVIGPGKSIEITLADEGSGAGPVNLSNLILRDPFGNQVPGTVSWNAGIPGTKTWEVYYFPDSPVTTGGLYTYTIVPVDAAYNIGPAITYSFEIIDTAMPNISSVNVKDSAGTTVEELTLSTSTQIDFPVASVECSLLSGGTAAVNWAKSTVVVKVDDGTGNSINGTVTHSGSSSEIVFTPASELMDGGYLVQVTAESATGFKGEAQYSFFISTKDAVCIGFNGVTSTAATDGTYMRMLPRMAASTGITDGGGLPVLPLDFAVFIPATVPANGSNVVFSNPVRVSVSPVTGTHSFPITFVSGICPAVIRLHYTDADVANVLDALNLTEADLKVWVLNGATWSQVSGANTPVASTITDDHYIEFKVNSIAGPDNIYALMYLPDATNPVIYNFKNTKVFNPVTGGPARIFYTQNIASIGLLGGTGNVKAGIYSTAGVLVRMLEYQDAAENAAVFNPAVNYEQDLTSSARNYFFTWDGRNDRGAYVRNGIYVIKIELTTAAGARSTLSRTIAVIK
jgi:hypothetical protein